MIVINANHAGFTVCLFYGAVGRVMLGPSMSAPAESTGRWRGGGGRGDLDDVCLDIQLVMLACLKASWLNRGCVVSHE